MANQLLLWVEKYHHTAEVNMVLPWYNKATDQCLLAGNQ
jgi:hypothetical protein